MDFKIPDATNCSPVVLLCFLSPKRMPEMDEEEENRVTMRGRNVNTATPQSGNCTHKFFHLFKSCMGRVTA